jgi:outer membrane protein
MKRTKWIPAVLAAISLSAPVLADNSVITGLDDDSVPDVSDRDASQTAWRFLVGGGLAYVPRYEGAAEHRWRPVPLVEASYGRFFVGTARGIGYLFATGPGLQFGARIGSAPARDESVDPHLAGLGSLDRSGEAGVFLNARFGAGYLSSSVAGGSRGSHADLGAGVDFPLSVADHLRVGAMASWANADYMQVYFGVTPEQSAASGLAQYDAGGGMRSYSVTASWRHVFNAHWMAAVSVSGKRLAGSAQDSPVVRSENANSASCVAIYRF